MQSTGSSRAKDKPMSVRHLGHHHLGHHIDGETYRSTSERLLERRNLAGNQLVATWPDGTRGCGPNRACFWMQASVWA